MKFNKFALIAFAVFFLIFTETSFANPRRTAFLQGTGTTDLLTPNRLNPATPLPINWISADLDSDYFSQTSSDKLTIETAGDYFFSATIPIQSSGQRLTIRTQLYLNGAPSDIGIGESTYTRGAGGHEESSGHIAVLLTDLSVGDEIELRTVQTSDVGSGEVTADGNISLYAEFVPASETVFSSKTMRTTDALGTDLNQAAHPLEWLAADRADTGFSTTANPEEVVIDDPGFYLVYFNLPLRVIDINETATTRRVSVRMEAFLNGVSIPGASARQGYIRQDENDHDAGGQIPDDAHEHSSIHWFGLIETTNPSEILTLTTQSDSSNTTIVNVQGGTFGSVYIQKIDPTIAVSSRSSSLLSGGTNWNANDIVDWGTDRFIDATIFDHTDTEKIKVLHDGDYLLTYSDALETVSGTIRQNPIVSIQKNGVNISGAATKTHYIRNDTGHARSSSTLSVLLENLVVDDEITVALSSEAAGGTVASTTDALLTLEYKSGFKITGTIENNLNQPINGVSIDVLENGLPFTTVSTNALGEYTIDCLDPNIAYTITPSIADHACPTTTGSLTTADVIEDITCIFTTDTDGDGIDDLIESVNGTSICDADTDADGLDDFEEVNVGADGLITDPLDADSDDDGISDGDEINASFTNPILFDTDGDGILDGTEIGAITPISPGITPCSATAYLGTDISIFVADADPTSTTNPNSNDTDNGSASDGDEDPNFNGAIDPGERDPNASDDDCPRSFCNGTCGERNLTELILNMDGSAGSILQNARVGSKVRTRLAKLGICPDLRRTQLNSLLNQGHTFYLNIWTDVWNSLIRVESNACEGFNSQCEINTSRDLTDRITENLDNLKNTALKVLRNRCRIRTDRSSPLALKRRKRIIRRIKKLAAAATLDATDYPDLVINCYN